jgi:predicted ribosomally synthesized peptide with SipW-like signal peptide
MKKFIFGMVALMLVVAATVGITSALFSDSASTTGDSFKAGTLDVNAGASSWTSGLPDTMKPGDVITLSLQAKNDGSLPFTYTVATSITGTIAGYPCSPVVSAIRGTGDNYIAAGGADNIEVDVYFPTCADNSYQGLTGNLVVTFNAVQ